jgi:hypothetical protein
MSDDVTEEIFRRSATVCRTLFHALRNLLRVLPHESSIRVPETPSTFIRTHNEALIVAAMRVSNENRSPLGIHD